MDADPPSGRSTNAETRLPVRAALPESQPGALDAPPKPGTAEDSAEAWRDRALRLQAEMENYRKRQQRLATERIAEERERLLRRFLEVADDLERALSVSPADAAWLREGVRLAHRTLMQQLKQEGVERIQAEGLPFDPRWHEAVGTAPQHEPGIQRQTVVEVQRPGYRIGDRLLRPARVIVSA
jgi:molecular chaperone GrpE